MTAPSLEQQLLEYRAILEHAGIAVIFTRDRRVERCNARAEALFGWPAGTLVGQPGRVFYPDDDAYETLGRAAGPVLAAGETYTTDAELARRDGSRFIGHVIARAIDPTHLDAGTIWIATDVTAERAETAARQRLLREQERIFERVRAGILFTDHERRVLRCNSHFFDIFGYTADELVGRSTRLLCFDDASWLALGQRGYGAVARDGSYVAEEPFRHRDGRRIWCRLSGSMLDPARPEEGFVWVYEDISERRAADERLQRLMQEQQLIFDRANIGIAFIRDRVIQRCNRRFEDMLGFAPGTACGQSTRVYFRSEREWQDIGAAAYGGIASRGAFQGEYILQRQDGTPIWCRFSGTLLDPSNPDRGYVWLHEDVDERHATEAALEDARRQQALIFDNAMVGISYQRNRVILRCNRRLEEIFGYPPGGLDNQPTRILYRNEADWIEAGRRAFGDNSEGAVFDGIIPFARADGTPIQVHLVGRAIANEEGNSTWIWSYQDVTARQATEAALAQTTREYALIFDNAMIGISYQRERVILRCNRRLEEIFGFTPGTLAGQNTRVLFANDADWEEAGKMVYQQGAGPHTFDGIVRYQRQDGVPIWVHIVGRTIDTDQLGVTWIWAYEDVSARRAAEAALHDTMRDYAQIFDNALVGILHVRRRTILRCNARMEEICGVTPGLLAGNDTRAMFADDEEFRRTNELILQRPNPRAEFGDDVRFRRRDGRIIWVRVNGRPAGDRDSADWIWTVQDVTLEHEAHDALRQSHAELETRVAERTTELRQQLHFLGQLIEAIPGPLFYKDADGHYLGCNQVYAEFIGIDRDALIGKTVFDIAPHDLAERYKAADYALLAGVGVQVYETRVQPRDGNARDVMFHKATFARMDGSAGGIVGVMLDITERKQAEAALAQAKREVDALNASLEQRVNAAVAELANTHRSLLAAHRQLTQAETMASLGRMVAVIAHELNTPIGNARLAASTLREKAGMFAGRMDRGVRRSDLDALLQAIATGTHLLDAGLQRAAHLISSFKQIAVDQTSSQRRVFALDTLIDEIATTLEPSIRRSGHQLVWNVEPGIELDSYPGPLGHVLINLIDNALRHAFEGVEGVEGGRIEVSVTRINTPGEAMENAIELRVSDNGLGIPAAHQQRVFEPFFTTQMGRGGTGLGLSIAYNIVNGMLGGSLALSSEPGLGTCFIVTLPQRSPDTAANS